MLPKLQYISQGHKPDEHLSQIKEALDAGVSFIQLRLKEVSESTYVTYGLMAQELCATYKALLIINDHPLVASRCKADAVHLGLNDMSVTEARKLLGSKLIGGTANTFENIIGRCSEKVDYIGLGPLRQTTTKKKLSPVLGIHGYQVLLTQMNQLQLNVPVFAIGGITLSDMEELMKTNVYGIAISGLITQSSNKKKLVAELNKHLYHA